MSIRELIDRLQDLNIKLRLEGHQLKVLSQQNPPEELLSELRDKKEQLISYLRSSIGSNKYQPIFPVSKSAFYDVSHAQKRLYIENEITGDKSVYNQLKCFVFSGDLDLNAFKKALLYLVNRHEIFRTTFHWVNDELKQRVSDVSENLAIEYIELSLADKEAEENELRRVIHKETSISFDLNQGPLFRASLIKVDEFRFVFLFNTHHIISDAWSVNVIINEIARLYNAFLENEDDPLLPLKIQYKDYCAWQNRLLHDSMHELENYWVQIFKTPAVPLQLPTSFPRPTVNKFEGRVLDVIFEDEISDSIKKLSNQCNTSIYTTLLATIKALFFKYTYQEDITVGTAVAGRDHYDLEEQVGVYINTVALRTQFDASQDFITLLRHVKETVHGAFQHQAFPFDMLVDVLKIDRKNALSPLFNVMVDLKIINDNLLTRGDNVALNGIEVSPFSWSSGISRFDLTFNFVYSATGLSLGLNYNTQLFDESFIDRMVQHLKNLIRSVSLSPETALSSLQYLKQEEKQQLLLKSFNSKPSNLSDPVLFQKLFEKQVKKTPNKVAVTFNGEALTYQQLNEKVNRLGLFLRQSHNAKQETIVGLMVDRSINMLIGVLGIIKSGATYLPVDPELPNQRIKYLINDSGTKTVITQKHLMASIESCPLEVIDIDDPQIVSLPSENIPVINSLDDTIYTMYTSGSTGRPKGVKVRHSSVVNFLESMAIQPGIISEDKVLAITTVSFDISVLELFLPLLNGATVQIISRDVVKDTPQLIEQIKHLKPSIMQATPSLWGLLLDAGWEGDSSLKVLCGGEKLSRELGKRLLQKVSSLWNMYGPTETTVWSTIKEIRKPEDTMSIGRPIQNTSVYVLDKSLQLLPIGIAGEICIGGAGVAKGYHDQEELTQFRFINNPFREGLLYRTGDLGRWSVDGDLEYLGRADNQVKIQGHRIELAEIETTLRLFHAIENAVVAEKKDNNGTTYLVGYLITKRKFELTDLRKHLMGHLPPVMHPSLFVNIDRFPLTPSGKVDVSLLLKISDEEMLNSKAYVAPENNTEREVMEIWHEVLGLNRVFGIDDDFFEIGGNSLKAIQVASRVHKKFNTRILIPDILKAPTIRELSALLISLSTELFEEIPTSAKQEHYDLSQAQMSLWLWEHMGNDYRQHNIVNAFKIEGSINVEIFQRALEILIQRHETLRTSFSIVDAVPKQVIHDKVGLRLRQIDFTGEKDAEVLVKDELEKEKNVKFSLNLAPLLNASIISIAPKECVLILNFHHLITDAWSIEIFFKELIRVYTDISNGNDNHQFVPFRIQYKDYAAWQNGRLAGNESIKHKDYWLKRFRGEPPVLNLPIDGKRSFVNSSTGNRVGITFDKDIVSEVRTVCRQLGVTPFMFYLSLTKTLLYRYTNQEDIIIGAPVTGRTHSDLEHQIGFFVNVLPLRTQFSAKETFRILLNEVKIQFSEAVQHQIYPFHKLYSDIDSKRDWNNLPLFDVIVMLQNESVSIPTDEIKSLSVQDYKFDSKTCKYPLSIMFNDHQETLFLSIEYNSSLFFKTKIERMLSHFKSLLAAIIKDLDKPLYSYDYLSNDEKIELTSFNKPTIEKQKTTVLDLFKLQARSNPNHNALIIGNESFTYERLDQLSDRLASFMIRSNRCSHGTAIGVLMDKSLYSVISLLAIMKAGGVYVPIDTGFPAQRIFHIIESASIDALLISNDDHLSLDHFKGDVIRVDEIVNNETENISINSLCKYKDVAYIIYTSGTTGNPKGVIVAHNGLVETVLSYSREFGVNSSDRYLQFMSFAFDGSILDIFTALCSGAAIVIADKAIIENTALFISYLRSQKVTIFAVTPSYLKILNKDPLETVRTIISVGEAVQMDDALFYGKIKNFYNGYGPSEATVCTSLFKVDTQKNYTTIPIGRPHSNKEVYILDEFGRLVPIGIRGEIHIGGDGIAKGYLNDLELTNSKFIPNPFRPGQKFYKTGDYGRWLADGNMEYLGRVDSQIKLSGYRVEVEEVRTLILKYNGIRDVALMQKPLTNELIAYIVIQNNQHVSIELLRVYLKELLPQFMIPHHVIKVKSIPLTLNGKIDFESMSVVEKIEEEEDHREVQVEEGGVLETLLQVWAKVFARENIKPDDNFYEIGGDSIKAIQIAARLYHVGWKVETKDVFQYSIQEIVPKLKRIKLLADQTLVTGAIPLSPIQNEFFAWNLPNRNHFNQSVMVFSKKILDEGVIEQIFTKILEHHDILRANFVSENGQISQVIQSLENRFEMKVYHYEDDVNESLNKDVNDLQKSILIDRGSLIKLGLFKSPDGCRLLIVSHHLIMDGISWRILLDDFESLLDQCNNNLPLNLPPKSNSYKAWAERINLYANSNDLLSEKEFWAEIENRPVQLIKPDNEHGSNKYADTVSETLTLDQDYTNLLLTKVNSAFNTDVKDILLAALGLSFVSAFNVQDIFIDLETHGREQLFDELDFSRTIGWFTAHYPLFLNFRSPEKLKDTIIEVKETLRKVPRKGVGYGILKFNTDDIHKSNLNFKNNPQVLFNYLGQFETDNRQSQIDFANEEKGLSVSLDNNRSYLLEVSCMIAQKKLSISILYNKHHYNRDTVKDLLELYKVNLKRLIDFCAQSNQAYVTPSDLMYDKLSVEEIENFFE